MKSQKYAFPSSPQRPPVSTVFCKGGGRELTVPFGAQFAARRFIEMICGDLTPKWTSDDEFELPNGVTVRCEQLQDIMEYEYEGGEADWKLPQPYLGYLLSFVAHVTGDDATPANDTAESKPKTAAASKSAPSKAAEPGPKATKTAPRADRSRSTANDSRQPARAASGHASRFELAEIAAKLGVEPKAARVALRNLNEPKPSSSGWVWATQAEADAVEAKLRKALRK